MVAVYLTVSQQLNILSNIHTLSSHKPQKTKYHIKKLPLLRYFIMRFSIISTLASAGTALGNATFIVASLTAMAGSIGTFEQTVNNWDGSLLKAPTILTNVNKLIKDIQDGAVIIAAAPAYEKEDLGAVAIATAPLLTSVRTTVDATISAKAKFEKVPVVGPPIVRQSMQSLKVGVTAVGTAIVGRTPVEQQDMVKAIVEAIQGQLDRGLVAFA